MFTFRSVYPIKWFNPATFLCLSQARTWISNTIFHGLFFCIQYVRSICLFYFTLVKLFKLPFHNIYLHVFVLHQYDQSLKAILWLISFFNILNLFPLTFFGLYGSKWTYIVITFLNFNIVFFYIIYLFPLTSFGLYASKWTYIVLIFLNFNIIFFYIINLFPLTSFGLYASKWTNIVLTFLNFNIVFFLQ